MAFLFKRPRSPFWHAGFIDLHGKRRNRSTKVTNRKEAQKIADAYEEAAKKKRTARQVRDVISQLHNEISGENLPSQSFRIFSTAWLEQRTPEVSKATLVFYKNAVSKFTAFLGATADEEMTSISANHLTKFRNHEAKTLASKTVNHDLKCLRMLFKAARRDRVISEDPSEFVKATRNQPSSIRRPFTTEELGAIMRVADHEWKSLIRLGLYTGQRLGDLAALTWQNVDLKRSEIRITTQKTQKAVVIPISSYLSSCLEKLPKPHSGPSPIHPEAYRCWKSSGKTSNLSKRFVKLLALAGLRQKPDTNKSKAPRGRGIGSSQGGLSFHCLRHTAVTILKEAGIPQAVVMELVGHQSEQMSAHYTHVGTEALKKATSVFPEL